MPPFRVLLGLSLVLAAAAVAVGAALQLARGRQLSTRPGGLVRDVHDVRRRSAAALAEAVGVLVLALGMLARQRTLVLAGAVTLAVGALLMSFARRGLRR